MTNLATAVTVTAKQRPVIAEDTAQPGCHLILAFDSGLKDFLPVGRTPGRHGRSRNCPPLAPQRTHAPQPRPPPVLSTSLIPRPLRILDPQVALGQCILVLSLGPLPGSQAMLGGFLKHRTRMIRHLNYPHDQATRASRPSPGLRPEQGQAIMLSEAGEVLDIERRQRQPVGDAAGGDPRVVDRPGPAALRRGSRQLTPHSRDALASRD